MKNYNLSYKQKKALFFIYNLSAGIPKDMLDDLYEYFYNKNEMCISFDRAKDIINTCLPIANANNGIDIKNTSIPKTKEKQCCANCIFAHYYEYGYYDNMPYWFDVDEMDSEELADYDYVLDGASFGYCDNSKSGLYRKEINPYGAICPLWEKLLAKDINKYNKLLKKE